MSPKFEHDSGNRDIIEQADRAINGSPLPANYKSYHTRHVTAEIHSTEGIDTHAKCHSYMDIPPCSDHGNIYSTARDKQVTDWGGVMKDLFYNLDNMDSGSYYCNSLHICINCSYKMHAY